MEVPVCQEIPDHAVNAAHHLLSGMTAGGGFNWELRMNGTQIELMEQINTDFDFTKEKAEEIENWEWNADDWIKRIYQDLIITNNTKWTIESTGEQASSVHIVETSS